MLCHGIALTTIEAYEKCCHLNKPLIMECQGGQEFQDAIMMLRDNGICAYPMPEQAVEAMVSLQTYGKMLEDPKN